MVVGISEKKVSDMLRVATAERGGLLKEYVQQANLKRKNLKSSTCNCISSYFVGRKGQRQRTR